MNRLKENENENVKRLDNRGREEKKQKIRKITEKKKRKQRNENKTR